MADKVSTTTVGVKDKSVGAIIYTILVIIILSFLSFAQVFPFYLQVVTSFSSIDIKPEPGVLYLWPSDGILHFSNYVDAFIKGDLLRGTINTLIVSLSFTVLTSLVILICGYVITKKNFRGRKFVDFCFLITMMVPGELLMVTNYNLVSTLGWTSSYAALILPGLVNVAGILLVKAFMDSVPDACLESAKIDGASELRILFQIVLPMCMPVLTTYFILTFVAQWNDYLWPMLVTSDSSLFTIQLKLYNFNIGGGREEEVLKAAALISTLIPIIIVYILCQKKFVGGLNFSGVK